LSWRVDFIRYDQVELEGKFYEVEVIERDVGRGNTSGEALDSVPERYIVAIESRGVEYALVSAFEDKPGEKQ